MRPRWILGSLATAALLATSIASAGERRWFATEMKSAEPAVDALEGPALAPEATRPAFVQALAHKLEAEPRPAFGSLFQTPERRGYVDPSTIVDPRRPKTKEWTGKIAPAKSVAVKVDPSRFKVAHQPEDVHVVSDWTMPRIRGATKRDSIASKPKADRTSRMVDSTHLPTPHSSAADATSNHHRLGSRFALHGLVNPRVAPPVEPLPPADVNALAHEPAAPASLELPAAPAVVGNAMPDYDWTDARLDLEAADFAADEPVAVPEGFIPYDEEQATRCSDALLHSTVNEEREAAIQTLAKMVGWAHCQRAPMALRQVALSDYNADLRILAVRMLGALPAEPALVEDTLKLSVQYDSDPTVKALAEETLQRLAEASEATEEGPTFVR